MPRFSNVLPAAMIALMLQSPPAIAAEPIGEVTLPNPWVAGGLSITAPVMLGSVTLSAFGAGAPVGFGAGHVYAGDPARGFWVALGGASTMAAAGAYGMYGPNDDARPRRFQAALTNIVCAAAAYALFSGWDAYWTAERAANHARTTW